MLTGVFLGLGVTLALIILFVSKKKAKKDPSKIE
jgi:hypothetical protein